MRGGGGGDMQMKIGRGSGESRVINILPGITS